MWKTPLFDLAIGAEERQAINQVIDSGWLTLGDRTREFEEAFAAFIGVKYAVAVSSGTAALHIANRALDIGKGDEVVCPDLTFIAGANSIVYTGARPVFADIESLDNLNISPASIEAMITEKTVAIQVVHYAGYPCDMKNIMAIAQKNGLAVIEDCAHAPGAVYGGKKCGSIGDIGCFSFFPNKNMTTCEGGMLTTNDGDVARKARLLLSHGMTSISYDRYKGQAFSYDVVDLGYNYRIDEIRSAMGVAQLKKLSDYNMRRQIIADRYLERLGDLERVTIPFGKDENSVSSHHIMPLILAEDIDRPSFMERMKKGGVQTGIHYPLTHTFSFYRDAYPVDDASVPLSVMAASREVTIPLYPAMSDADVDYVCEMVAESLSC